MTSVERRVRIGTGSRTRTPEKKHHSARLPRGAPNRRDRRWRSAGNLLASRDKFDAGWRSPANPSGFCQACQPGQREGYHPQRNVVEPCNEPLNRLITSPRGPSNPESKDQSCRIDRRLIPDEPAISCQDQTHRHRVDPSHPDGHPHRGRMPAWTITARHPRTASTGPAILSHRPRASSKTAPSNRTESRKKW